MRPRPISGLLALLLLALAAAPALAQTWPPDNPCVRKVLAYELNAGCRGSDGRTDAVCWHVVGTRPTTEMLCLDTDANGRGDVCLVAHYSVTYDPYHRGGALPACVPGAV